MHSFFTTPTELRDRAPDLARRIAAILLGLAGVMARRFLKNPRLVALIVPLWRHLTRIAGRFARAVAAPVRVRTPHTAAPGPARARAVRLPSGRGWLLRELGHEAAGYGSQLAHVLAEPDMQALISAVPGVGRVLRPICRMLGYDLAEVTKLVPPPAPAAPIPVPAARAQAPAHSQGADHPNLAYVIEINNYNETII